MEPRPEITAENILATAKRLGVRLTPGTWMTEDGKGCAAGVATLMLEGATTIRSLGIADADKVLSYSERVGLGRGFEVPAWQDSREKEIAKHQRIGRAVRAAIANTRHD